MAVKSKYLMLEISSQIQFLQKDITNLTEIFQQRREILEKHCRQCRDLFKPWPSKIARTFCSDDAKDESVIKFEDDKQCNSFQAECEKEKEELALLDDILAKAQHAREIQSKIKSTRIKKSCSLKSTKGVSSHGMEAKIKPKVSYPVLKRHSPAKSTYATSYTKPARMKHSVSGGKKTISNCSKSKTQGQESKRKEEQNKTTSDEMKTSLKHMRRNVAAASVEEGLVNRTASETTKSVSEGKFLILENGVDLSMPSEFSEVYKKNKKLQSKVQKAKNLVPGQNEEQFMAKTEDFFALRFPSVSTLSEEIRRLEIEYRNILRRIRVTALCGLDSFERNELDGRSEWLTLMMKYEQLNEDTRTLYESLCKMSMHCPFSEHRSRHAKFFEKPDTQKCQDPGDLLSSSFTNLEQECWKVDSNGFFSYHDIKELATLLKLSHDYNIMKYQLELKTVVGETVLPLLKQLPGNHESFIPLCHAVYSILCCEGEKFPTLVKDTLPED